MKNESKTALELMRLEGICKLIMDNVEEESLVNRYLRITEKGKVDDLQKAIRQCTKSQLIKIVDVSSEISDELILQYFDNYRYGMKPGFVLNWANGFVGRTLTKESIKTKLQSELSTYTYSEGCTFKDLKCSDVEMWVEKGIPIFEIGLNYLKKHNYIDENEKFNHVYEVVDCFVWVCSEKGFVAIYNMPPFIEKLLKKAFYSIYEIKIVGISLDKKILDTIFDPSRRKKVSLTQLKDNPEMPQKATFSDSNFGEKESGILKEFSDGYGLTSCLYDEEIKGDIVTMGVNNNKGKLYINVIGLRELGITSEQINVNMQGKMGFDTFGNPIKVGDKILYLHRMEMYTTVGIVRKLASKNCIMDIEKNRFGQITYKKPYMEIISLTALGLSEDIIKKENRY